MIILDEPSLGLAPIIIQQIFEIIGHLREEGITVFLVEQNAHQALNLADRGYMLELVVFACTIPAKTCWRTRRCGRRIWGLRLPEKHKSRRGPALLRLFSGMARSVTLRCRIVPYNLQRLRRWCVNKIVILLYDVAWNCNHIGARGFDGIMGSSRLHRRNGSRPPAPDRCRRRCRRSCHRRIRCRHSW